jgi:hypothetical protein
MHSPTSADFVLLIGLLVEVVGVIVLVRTSDVGFNFILRHLGRSVPNDWIERVQRVRNRNRLQTAVGIAILIVGILMQYYGLLSEKMAH